MHVFCWDPLIFPLNEIYTLTYLTGERQGMPAISCQIHSGWKPMHQTPPPSKRICIVEEMKPWFKYFFSLALINTYHRLWCGKIIHAKFVFLVSTIFERIFSLSVFFQDVYALCKPERYLRWCAAQKNLFFSRTRKQLLRQRKIIAALLFFFLAFLPSPSLPSYKDLWRCVLLLLLHYCLILLFKERGYSCVLAGNLKA